jgi:uncharacterized protein (TIGR03067 family)
MVGVAIVIGAAGTPSSAAPTLKDPAPADVSPVVGEWQVERIERGAMRAEPFPGVMRYVFTPDGRWVEWLAGRRREGTYKASTKGSPAALDLDRPPAGTADSGFGPGIFKVDGDTLTICVRSEPGDRPAAFDASDAAHSILITLKRAKKKE